MPPGTRRRRLASKHVPRHRPKDQGPGVAPPEAEVRELVARIAELGSGTKTRAYGITPGTEWLMRRAMGNMALRTQLFRFVDALPAMADDADLYRHVEEYFGGEVLPGPLALSSRCSSRQAEPGRQTKSSNATTSGPGPGRGRDQAHGSRPGLCCSHRGGRRLVGGPAAHGNLGGRAADGAQVWFDLERYDVKHVTHRFVRDLLSRPELADLQAGLVVQTYLRDSYEDLAALCEWATTREVPLGIRLVKGAYWDTETVVAEAASWPVPVYEQKAETDANFERCVRLVHSYHGRVRAAFGSHNLRSLAYAIAAARAAGIPDNGYEVQLLWGMAEPVHEAFRQLGFRLRVYSPMGELVPGMAYLVRRLLENTSNESFVRQRFAEHKDLASLVAAPGADLQAVPAAVLSPAVVPRAATEAHQPRPYAPEPLVRWFAPGAPSLMSGALATVRACLGGDVHGLIGASELCTQRKIISVDPAEPARIVAVSDCCGPSEADRAVEAAESAFGAWSRAAATERAGVLFRAADWLRRRKFEVAALEVFEAGKCWDDADADVAEAIDFLEYYGREGMRLAEGGKVQSPPGEVNRLTYHGRGVAAVISPWTTST